MKTTDPRDPLDKKIDELLASQPAKAPDDFVARTLAAVEAEPEKKEPAGFAPLIRFALPIAAALALAFVVVSQFDTSSIDTPVEVSSDRITNTQPKSSEDLIDTEIDELLMLQEGLSGFADLDTSSLNSDGLLNTLDALYSI